MSCAATSGSSTPWCMNTPSVMIGQAAQKFDEQGRLTDQPTREIIGQLLVALAEWTNACRR